MNRWLRGKDLSLVGRRLLYDKHIVFFSSLLIYQDFKTYLKISFLQVQPKKKGSRAEDLGLPDPDRICGKQYELVHRYDTKLALKACKDVSNVMLRSTKEISC